MIDLNLTFDDVLLVPKYSEIESRSTIDLSIQINKLIFKHPIIPANMKTIMSLEMAEKIIQNGGLAILHRFMPIAEQIAMVEDLIDHFGNKNLAVSIGIKEEDKNNIQQFNELDVKIVCIDIAHGDSKQCINMIQWIKSNFPHMHVIAGNVATGKGAERLWKAGADTVKCGVGGGSLCSTRIETGNGVPQLTALMDVFHVRNNIQLELKRKLAIIADGGIKNAGDCVKALCFSDMVMVGNLFSGCKETPGTLISVDGQLFKEYAGSSTHKTNHIEGVVALVKQKGTYEEILTKLLEGIRSGCSYQGACNLTNLKINPQFVKMSSAGLRESHPHDVIIK